MYNINMKNKTRKQMRKVNVNLIKNAKKIAYRRLKKYSIYALVALVVETGIIAGLISFQDIDYKAGIFISALNLLNLVT